ncbi:SDR family NAD(P)-dependent oxidoreductase [Nocardia pseudobrasiliensis]|uniref:SDR family NAD(P)-dependent oxidoreductase n=1 Tax=Nocardia pseudobrasiliensis TaxID=45979 RepID=UPI001B87AB2C|nr:SDR family NAD(P)-dependent oxidoreductase [Nocardia pseudobrasiliensis]
MNQSKSSDVRHVVVTGAAGSLARPVVRSLAERGYRVHAAVHRPEQLDIYADVPGVQCDVMDVTDAVSVGAYGDAIRSASGGLYALVNCAGIAVQGPLELMGENEFIRVVDINVGGILRATNGLLPALRTYAGPGRPRIVNISAGTGRTAVPLFGLASASKSAVDSLSAAYRLELARFGIHVVSVAMGAVESDIHEKSAAALRRTALERPDLSDMLYRDTIEHLTARMDKYNLMDPRVAAEHVVGIVERENPRARCAVGRDARVLAGIAFLPDRIRDVLMSRGMGLV